MENDRDGREGNAFSPDEITSELRSEVVRLETIERAIAASAVHFAYEKEQLIDAAQATALKATRVLDLVTAIEIVEPEHELFGGEESYGTVLRMFTIEDNVGKLRSIDSIWEYLSLNYDMRQESIASLQETLFEWKDDIEEDAAAQGVRGSFTQYDGGFMFAETASSFAARAQVKAAKMLETDVPTISKVIRTRPVTIQSTVVPEEDVYQELKDTRSDTEKLHDKILDLLGRAPDEGAKQANVKKELHDGEKKFSSHAAQVIIDEMVSAGVIFKYRRNKVAHLSLLPHEDELIIDADGSKAEMEQIDDVDLASSVEILESLVAPGTHFNQKLTLSELWRRINDADTKSQSIPASDLEYLKRVCRQLQKANLITAGGQKMGTGGVKTKSATSSKRRRSATREVFKVSLGTQDNKQRVQQILASGDSEELLRRYIVDIIN